MSPGDAVGCRALWVAVLMQALTDALVPGKNRDAAQHQRDADAWIRRGGPNFRLVCDLAGVDPAQVRARYIAGQMDLPKCGHAGQASKRAAA